MERRQLRIAGRLLVLGTLWTVAAIRIAEMLTPNYSLAGEAISGLGSTYLGTHVCFVEHCNTIYQPASFIFVSSQLVAGVLLLLSSYALSRVPVRKSVSRAIALLGLGTLVLFVSYLPLYMDGGAVNFTLAAVLHIGSSVFLVAVALILMMRADAFIQPRFKQISRILGIVVLVAIPVYASMFTTDSLWGPGFGGVERIGFYAIFAWSTLYGTYLIKTARNS